MSVNNEINKLIQKIAQEKPFKEVEAVISTYKSENLSPTTLGQIFEAYLREYDDKYIETKETSNRILIDDLIKIHPGFASTNGCQWARTDNSYLGKKYVLNRELKAGRVFSVELLGKNMKDTTSRPIRKEIREALKSERCAILDIGERIEIDHKNGRYDDNRVLNTDTQRIEDFQALSKAANDAKRQHCKECQRDKKRYDAKRLGYKAGWTEGDESSDFCEGCYWYDPHNFNEVISKEYK